MQKHAKMVTLYAALVIAVVGAWVGMDQLGVRPAFNGEVDAAEARVVEQITDLGKFSVVTRILTLQNDRRYYAGELRRAQDEFDRRPNNILATVIESFRRTLTDISTQITELRKLKEPGT